MDVPLAHRACWSTRFFLDQKGEPDRRTAMKRLLPQSPLPDGQWILLQGPSLASWRLQGASGGLPEFRGHAAYADTPPPAAQCAWIQALKPVRPDAGRQPSRELQQTL